MFVGNLKVHSDIRGICITPFFLMNFIIPTFKISYLVIHATFILAGRSMGVRVLPQGSVILETSKREGGCSYTPSHSPFWLFWVFFYFCYHSKSKLFTEEEGASSQGNSMLMVEKGQHYREVQEG